MVLIDRAAFIAAYAATGPIDQFKVVLEIERQRSRTASVVFGFNKGQ